MKKVSFNTLSFIPASHEDQNSPGVLKKVLFSGIDFIPEGKVEMINWALLPKDKSFIPHYHEDMDEIFIIISGKTRIKIGKEEELLEKGDAVLIPMRSIHEMENIGKKDVNYIVIGISLGKGGRTVTYES